MQYEVIITHGQEQIKRTDAEGNVAFIPFDEGNRDYQEYLAWKAEQAAA